MRIDYSYKLVGNEAIELALLKKSWLTSLSSPQDGMWETFRNNAEHWLIRNVDNDIGYACVDENLQLLQFYILPEYLQHGVEVFQGFIQKLSVKKSIVGTNNPIYLSLALHFVNDLNIHSYLFKNEYNAIIAEKEGSLKECQAEDKKRIVEFCHYSIGAPKDWLSWYIGALITKRELYVFENNAEIIGTCEVRKSKSATDIADIGMIISPKYRKMGYGTYLLNRAKNIALKFGKIPICSCEKDNVGSLKSIYNCGFVSIHQLLSIEFN